MRLLAISGSLRASSSNTLLLEAAAALAPSGIEIVVHDGIGQLPHFNPDIGDDKAPASVGAFRAALAGADGVIFSTPEYAHGLPGVLKNALDWVVGSSELVEKPVVLFNASPRSTYAVASLTETLTVMSAKVVAEAGATVQLAGRELPEGGIAADAEIAGALRRAIVEFARAIETGRR
jgi:NAD(P)H-dependent FMN reductase